MTLPPSTTNPGAPQRGPRPRAWLGYLIPPAMLAAVAGGFLIVMQGPRGVLWLIIGAGIVIPILWIVTSALWPAKADRRCPRCRGEKLVRMDPNTTVGLECTDCGYRDDAASSWLLAEEEGPLEDIVLEERKRRRRAPGSRSSSERIVMGRRSDVDSEVGTN